MKKIKFTADIKKTLLPFVTVKEGMFKGMNFLLDTGANNSILFKHAYEKVKNGLKKTDVTTSLSGLEGHENIVEIALGNLSFCNIGYTEPFLIVDSQPTTDNIYKETGLSFDGIIGTCFMNKNRWIIDIYRQEVIINPVLILQFKKFRIAL